MQNDPENNQTPELLSIGGASKFLHVSIDTLRRWEKKGKVKTYRSPGGHRYFKRDELKNLFGKRYKHTVKKTKTMPYHTIHAPEMHTVDHHTLGAAAAGKQLPKTDDYFIENKGPEGAPDGEEVAKEPTTPVTADEPTEVSVTPVHESFPEPHPLTSVPVNEYAAAPEHPEEKQEDLNEKPGHLTPSSVLDRATDKETSPEDLGLVTTLKTLSSDPTAEKVRSAARQPLNALFAESYEDTGSKLQKFIFGAFVAFLLVDIILLIIWQASTGSLTPLP